MHASRRYAGFTIVELLTVLSIIAILAAFLLPVFSAARNSARRSACLSHLKSLGTATLLYADNWEGQLPEVPPVVEPTRGGLRRGGGISTLWARWPEGSSSTYFRVQLALGVPHLAEGIFECPNDDGAPAFDFPYGSSVYDTNGTSYLWDPATSATYTGVDKLVAVNGKALSEIENPSEARLLQDYGATWHREGRPAGISLRTTAKVNVAFADGHAGQADVHQLTASLSTLLSGAQVASAPQSGLYTLAVPRK
ncbi:MAG TPA: type II secretion system protein [Armatimonadota bacterium]|jgi:prepilin-type N-terminal cleavage/methylation domain-containing protein/prepilin-type processing-associated H-X9-DG protein